jgi:hypothetical protein
LPPIGRRSGTSSSNGAGGGTGRAVIGGATKNGGRLAAVTSGVRVPCGTPATVKRPSAALCPVGPPIPTITPGMRASSPASSAPLAFSS